MKREASALLRKLVFDPNAEEWNEFDLAKLRGWELSILSQLLGGPKTSAKEEMVTRILSIRTVRQIIAKCGSSREACEEFAAGFRKEALKGMAKNMKLWRSGSKIQLTITLIQWRDRARHEGKKFLESISSADGHQQLQLGL